MVVMQLYDKVAAYQAVMAAIKAKVPNRSPQTWLAEQLGISRQLVHVWSEHTGIPEKYADQIAELLDMVPAQVCPSLVVTYLPETVFMAVLDGTTPKKPFHIRLIELLKSGLGECTATRHGKRKSAPLTKKPVEQPMKPIGGFIPISADELANQREEARKAGADLSVRGRSK